MSEEDFLNDEAALRSGRIWGLAFISLFVALGFVIGFFARGLFK